MAKEHQNLLELTRLHNRANDELMDFNDLLADEPQTNLTTLSNSRMQVITNPCIMECPQITSPTYQAQCMTLANFTNEISTSMSPLYFNGIGANPNRFTEAFMSRAQERHPSNQDQAFDNWSEASFSPSFSDIDAQYSYLQTLTAEGVMNDSPSSSISSDAINHSNAVAPWKSLSSPLQQNFLTLDDISSDLPNIYRPKAAKYNQQSSVNKIERHLKEAAKEPPVSKFGSGGLFGPVATPPSESLPENNIAPAPTPNAEMRAQRSCAPTSPQDILDARVSLDISIDLSNDYTCCQCLYSIFFASHSAITPDYDNI